MFGINARTVTNRLAEFVDLGKYANQLKRLSEEMEIPKFPTQLIT
jgi:hypothetical protein